MTYIMTKKPFLSKKKKSQKLESLLVVEIGSRPTMTQILAARNPLKSTADGVDRWGYTKVKI
jgi:hypothetical protein